MIYYTTREGGGMRRLKLGISGLKMRQLLSGESIAGCCAEIIERRGERVCRIQKGWRTVHAHSVYMPCGTAWDVVNGFRPGKWYKQEWRWYPCNCQHLSRYQMKISPTCPSHSEWLKPATRRPAHG